MAKLTQFKKVLVGIAHQTEYVHTRFVNSLMAMRGAKYPYEMFIKQEYRKLTDIARTNIVVSALRNDYDYVLFLDSDMVFEPTLIQELLKQNKDIVGALTWWRVPPYHPSIYRYNPKKKGLTGNWDSILFPEVQLPMINKKNPTELKGLIEVDAIGMAATLIKIEVFKKLDPPFFRFEREGGEDLSFCRRCKDEGFRIYCNTSARVGHITNQIIDFKNIEMYTKYRAFTTSFTQNNESKFSSN